MGTMPKYKKRKKGDVSYIVEFESSKKRRRIKTSISMQFVVDFEIGLNTQVGVKSVPMRSRKSSEWG